MSAAAVPTSTVAKTDAPFPPVSPTELPSPVSFPASSISSARRESIEAEATDKKNAHLDDDEAPKAKSPFACVTQGEFIAKDIKIKLPKGSAITCGMDCIVCHDVGDSILLFGQSTKGNRFGYYIEANMAEAEICATLRNVAKKDEAYFLYMIGGNEDAPALCQTIRRAILIIFGPDRPLSELINPNKGHTNSKSSQIAFISVCFESFLRFCRHDKPLLSIERRSSALMDRLHGMASKPT